MARIGTVSVGTTYFSAYVYELDINYGGSDRTIDWVVTLNGYTVRSGNSSLDAQVPAGGVIQFTNLTPGQTYVVSAAIHYANNTAVAYPTSATVTTHLISFTPTGAVDVTGVKSSSISVRVTDLSLVSGCRPIEISFYAQVNGSVQANGGTLTITDYYTTTTQVVTFNGLSPSTSYDIVCYIVYIGMSGVATQWDTYAYQYNVTTAAARPAKFSWSYPKANGRPQKENMPAWEWNAFRQNVIDVLGYKGYYASPSKATGGREVSQEHYNSILTALQTAGYARGLSRVSANSAVSALALNTLLDEVNAIE